MERSNTSVPGGTIDV